MKNPGLCVAVVMILSPFALAADQGWLEVPADIGVKNGLRIKALRYPQSAVSPLKSHAHGPHVSQKKVTPHRALAQAAERSAAAGIPTATVFADVIEAPPLDGFVPYVALTLTDERSYEDGDYTAVAVMSVTGNYLTSDANSYAMAIFDTGASSHVAGYAAATQLGLSGNYLTTSTTTISGVTGSVEADVSMPIGLFITGLANISASRAATFATNVIGQTNVAISAGQNPGDLPDLVTAVGSPLSSNFATWIRNDHPVTRNRGTKTYTSPDMRFYDLDDPCIPVYSNSIPLELRPLGAQSVQYVPNLLDLESMLDPSTPSIITGNGSQSLFFIASVDLANGRYSATDRTRFMLDTGAQVTVIGKRVASRLGLDPAQKQFEVDIEGVTGDSIAVPGFFIDSIEVPALGKWLSFTHVPVILLDIASPEGGTLDGILGTNLFTKYNLVLNGGGYFLQPDPSLDFELIPLTGDLSHDGNVNLVDLAEFVDCWLAVPASANWSAACDLAENDRINFADFAILAAHWLE